MLRTFGWALSVTALALATAFIYDGWHALLLCLILGVLEVSLSFDNAVVNATVLKRMTPFWQKMFMTVGILIAVLGMRLLLPLIIVSSTAHLSIPRAIHLALQNGSVHAPGSYAYVLTQAHSQIAAFGGAFLLLLFLDFVLEEREVKWLVPLERPLARLGVLKNVSVIITSGALLLVAELLADSAVKVLVAGVAGMISYLAVDAIGGLLEEYEETVVEGAEHLEGRAEVPAPRSARDRPVVTAARAGVFLFCYLEILDGSFSFDGVIGAFAITSDPILIALGLGLIGAMYVRSITVFLVRNGTLDDYIYLEHGAHWAIGSLAVLLLLSIGYDVPAALTGLVGVAFIVSALLSSHWSRKDADAADTEPANPSSVPAGR